MQANAISWRINKRRIFYMFECIVKWKQGIYYKVIELYVKIYTDAFLTCIVEPLVEKQKKIQFIVSITIYFGGGLLAAPYRTDYQFSHAAIWV